MIALIQPGISAPGGIWADLGAGSGNFTRALATVLGPGAVIYAIDREVAAQERVERYQGVQILWRRGDFLKPLPLPTLDGLIMSNALHFVRDPGAILPALAGYLRPGGSFLLVEYALNSPLSYVPYPISFARFAVLTAQAGLLRPQHIGYRQSPRTGIAMYAAVAYKPTS